MFIRFTLVMYIPKYVNFVLLYFDTDVLCYRQGVVIFIPGAVSLKADEIKIICNK
jgi:hypothetical protein